MRLVPGGEPFDQLLDDAKQRASYCDPRRDRRTSRQAGSWARVFANSAGMRACTVDTTPSLATQSPPDTTVIFAGWACILYLGTGLPWPHDDHAFFWGLGTGLVHTA